MLKILLFFVPILAFSYQIELNRHHSVVNFSVPYMGISQVTGSISSMKASAEIFKNNLKNIQIRLGTKSLTTNNFSRDKHLHGKDFFHVNNYPSITFKSTGSYLLNKKMLISGELTIKKIKKSVDLELTYLGKKIDHKKKLSHFFDFKLKIDRTDFGLTWNKLIETGAMLVGNKISIYGHSQFQTPSEKTSFSSHMVTDNNLIRETDLKKRKEIYKTLSNNELSKLNSKDKKTTVIQIPTVREAPPLISLIILFLFSVIGFLSLCYFAKSLIKNNIVSDTIMLLLGGILTASLYFFF